MGKAAPKPPSPILGHDSPEWMSYQRPLIVPPDTLWAAAIIMGLILETAHLMGKF